MDEPRTIASESFLRIRDLETQVHDLAVAQAASKQQLTAIYQVLDRIEKQLEGKSRYRIDFFTGILLHMVTGLALAAGVVWMLR